MNVPDPKSFHMGDNFVYGAEHIQTLDRQMNSSLTEFDWPSFAEVAKSLGGHGVKVTSPKELKIAIGIKNCDRRDSCEERAYHNRT